MFRAPTNGGLPFMGKGKGQGGRERHPWPMHSQPSGAERGSIRSAPYWDPSLEDSYPFRHWLADAIMWCLSTDLDENRKGPQIELSLGGIARDLVREIPYNIN